ncbi:MAG: potassium channel family protein [Ilumatobacteraceae bacterium]
MTSVADRPRPRRSALLEVRNWELLTAALLLLVVYVVRHTGAVLGTASDVADEVLKAAVMFLAMSSAGVSRRIWIVHVVVAGAAIGLSAVGVVTNSNALTMTANLLGAYMLGFATVLLLRITLRRRRVTGDTLFGALAIYLSLGIMFGIVYTAVARSYPEAFDPAQAISEGKTELYYFSFVTLTSLGYGDISPVYDSVQILATLEAILGVILLAALVGRVVGLLVAQQTRAESG